MTASEEPSVTNDMAAPMRPIAKTAELRRDLHADHVDLAADQLRGQIVPARRAGSTERIAAMMPGASAAPRCRKSGATPCAPKSRAASISISVMPRIEA